MSEQQAKNNPATEQGEGIDYGTYLWDMALKVESGKPSRELHRELKKHFGKKSGLPLYKRYPNAPIIVSVITSGFALLLSVVALIIGLYYT